MAEISKNRLQFVHCDKHFATREEAVQYVTTESYINRPSLYAEPMIMKYGEDEKNPNLILAIGAYGDGVTHSMDNKVFVIDVKELQEDIQYVVEKVDSIENTYLVGGRYDNITESIVLTLSDESEIFIEVTDLIEEWGVEEHPVTPIILEKKHVVYNEGDAEYRDILKADIRISENEKNILTKEVVNGHEALYVDGSASNITCWLEGEKTTVQDALKANQLKISGSLGNIITKRNDGIFATVGLDYDKATHTLTFKDGVNPDKVLALNAASVLEYCTYENGKLILNFKLSNGTTSKTEIPLSEIIKDFELDNTNHTVNLARVSDSENGQWKLSADVNVSTLSDNILEVTNNELFVKGTADNIKYDDEMSVEKAIMSLMDKVDDCENITTAVKHDIDSITIEQDAYDASRFALKVNSVVKGEVIVPQNSFEFSTNETDTVELLFSDNGDGKKLNANVKLDLANANILKVTDNGLSAFVNLAYDPTAHKLIFDNGIEAKEFSLVANSSVVDARYDENGDLILVIIKSDGSVEEVKVDLTTFEGGNNGNSPVTVHINDTAEGVKRITATLSVSNNENNLIISQDGSLFASKVASDHIGTYRDTEMTMQEALGKIADEIDAAALTGSDGGTSSSDVAALQAQMATLQAQLTNEITARQTLELTVSEMSKKIETFEEMFNSLRNISIADFGTYGNDENNGDEVTPEE